MNSTLRFPPLHRVMPPVLLLLNLVLFAWLSMLVHTPAFGQEDKLLIAGGGGAKNGSTYSSMIQTMIKFCSTDSLVLEEVNTNGGIQNLDLLKSLQVQAAVIPTDLLFAARMDNPASVSMIRTLFALHPEEFHLVARGDTRKEGGFSVGRFNIGGNEVTFRSPEALKGRKVGAVGGSVRSAQILSSYLKLNLQVTPFPSNVELMKGLLAGQVDAVLVVAGAPSDTMKALDSRYRLIPIRMNAELAAVYTPTKVQYEGMNDGKSVDTIATQALLSTRVFRSPDSLKQLAELRSCLTTKLPKIQDSSGVHAKWLSVDSADHGKWEWYELPAVKAAAPGPAVPAKAAKK